MNAKANNKEQGQTPPPAPPENAKSFSADVSRLLDIVANALYTNHDVFLRELISNAADACDRLRYDSITNPNLIKDNPDFRIHVFKDTKDRTLTVIDNGIGMNADELTENLGTIAKSGTAALMQQMKEQGGADKLKLIGQFGVGFYAGFMVAHRIRVVSRKAGEKEAWLWESDGRAGFTVTIADEEHARWLDGERGTTIKLDLKDQACDFLLDEKIKMTVKMYSDHISVPIFLGTPHETKHSESEKLNAASALWMRPKSEISAEQYTEFYRHLTGGFDEPLMTAHWKAEGKIEFTGLLYIPTLRPWDLFDPSRRHFVKLYVRRVFISEDVNTLMYPWLRFVRGIVDSEDLPLNISRESLQFNPVVSKIRSVVAKKILSDLDKLSRDDAPTFLSFWGQFGAVLKEGLYDAPEHRMELLKVCRFFSSHDGGEKLISLEDYVSRMKDGQDKIFFITGESLSSLRNSPQLEGFRARGLEVLFLTDTVDDFWLQKVLDYAGKPFKSITKGSINLDSFHKDESGEDKTPESEVGEHEQANIGGLIVRLADILQGKVQNIRKSQRLTDSPVCLVAADNSVDMHMERVLKIHQKYESSTKPVLEINPRHPLILRIASMAERGEDITESANLLLDQAIILQSEPLDDPSAFARRMSEIMLKALKEK
ncbi:MAG: molecular chaperone HtpG [Alphaproteobacteria bacterium]|nr:molecular chaperone HtpG [Alphaproteobacteria bacterium]MBP7758831.1 molecular chaperone HtpG [Alphaproteobacteria bacterium]MBP7762095.1 molecular chaperone HtpG [Alphaproteobacteria bacterium]MBP7904652.1 molecular chaperone HtpG [Alphaproteobacteria bacterium]